MKTVKLADHGHFKAKEILPVVIDSAQGVTVAQMRERVKSLATLPAATETREQRRERDKILDALDEATDTLTLDDANFNTFKLAVESFHFTIVHPDLLAVLEAATTPVEAPAA